MEVAGDEVSAGHVDALENILLLHFTDIEEYGKALGVQQNYDAGIRKQRWARGILTLNTVLLYFSMRFLKKLLTPSFTK